MLRYMNCRNLGARYSPVARLTSRRREGLRSDSPLFRPAPVSATWQWRFASCAAAFGPGRSWRCRHRRFCGECGLDLQRGRATRLDCGLGVGGAEIVSGEMQATEWPFERGLKCCAARCDVREHARQAEEQRFAD